MSAITELEEFIESTQRGVQLFAISQICQHEIVVDVESHWNRSGVKILKCVRCNRIRFSTERDFREFTLSDCM